ncbi:MAG: Spy/CpxP family protein refolding chaperone [Burkholderiaceae bacterium]
MGQSFRGRAAAHVSPRGVRLMLVGLLVAGAAAVSVPAWSQGGESHRMGGHHAMHGGGMGDGMRMGERMLDAVNATDAQRAQIKQIMQAARDDLKAQRDANRGLRERSLQIFAAPTVDAAQAESVRQQMIAQHDASSRRMLQAMLDASRVLTPEQRAKLAERVKERTARMQEHMQRHQGDAARK